MSDYYHYTDCPSLEQIEKSKMIMQSKGDGPARDAVYGDGVYFTTMSPQSTKEEIARNNYDDNALPEMKIGEGKLDCVIKVTFQEPLEKCDTEREVYIYKGDVDLTEYPYKTIKP